MGTQYIGVDYSTRKLAVALIHEEDRPVVKSVQMPTRTYKSRISAMSEVHYQFADFLGDRKNWNPLCIAIESPIMGASRDVQTAIWMAMTCGALAIAASDWGVDPMLVPPATWKKRVCGRGNMNKTEVAEYFGNRFPVYDALCSSDDERDAMCLALYAEAIDKERNDGGQEAAKAAVGR